MKYGVCSEAISDWSSDTFPSSLVSLTVFSGNTLKKPSQALVDYLYKLIVILSVLLIHSLYQLYLCFFVRGLVMFTLLNICLQTNCRWHN